MDVLTLHRDGSEKIIYMDQKCWINLAKIYYGNPTKSERNLLNKIIDTSENGTAAFPISMVHLSETSSISKPRWRQQLSSLMASISKCYTLTPHWTRILDIEIQNLVLKTLGLPQYNIRKYWLGRGIPHLIGQKPSVISDGHIDLKVLKKLEKELLNILDDPKSLELLLTKKFSDKSLERENINAVNQFEKIRKNLQIIKDNDLRHRCFLAQNITATITPRLVKTLIKFKLPKEFIKILIPQDDIEKFLTSIPTALCEFKLLFYRDQQLQRSIKVNDIADIWHLTLAIPYSDVVITENMWVTIAKQAKLDIICDTKMLSSIMDLIDYL